MRHPKLASSKTMFGVTNCTGKLNLYTFYVLQIIRIRIEIFDKFELSIKNDYLEKYDQLTSYMDLNKIFMSIITVKLQIHFNTLLISNIRNNGSLI